jgi:hypothetical protein
MGTFCCVPEETPSPMGGEGKEESEEELFEPEQDKIDVERIKDSVATPQIRNSKEITTGNTTRHFFMDGKSRDCWLQ